MKKSLKGDKSIIVLFISLSGDAKLIQDCALSKEFNRKTKI
jgi:hypothetical protein